MTEIPEKSCPIQLDRTYETIVIGAGIAGLTAAYSLASSGSDILVLEANEYAGGRIRTIHYKDVYAESGALVVTEEEQETLGLLQSLDCDSLIELGLHGAEIFFGKKISYLSRIDLEVKNFADLVSLFRLLAAGLFDRGRTLPVPGPGLYLAYRRVLRAMRKHGAEIEFPYQPYLQKETDQISFGQFLDSFHPHLRPYFDLQLKVTAGALSDEISLFWGLVTFHWNIDGKFYFLRGGTSVLPENIASSLGNRLHLGIKVLSVADNPAFAEITFACLCGGNQR